MSKSGIDNPLWSTAAVERLFAHGGIAFVIVSIKREMVDVNQAFCDMLGYRRDEVVGRSIDEITHPDDVGMTNRLFKEARGRNVVVSFEKRYLGKQGKVVWCKGRSEPVEDHADNFYRLVMLENITSRKQNELVKRQIAAIVDASEDAMYCSGQKGEDRKSVV